MLRNHESYHSFESSSKVKNKWGFTTTPVLSLRKVWCISTGSILPSTLIKISCLERHLEGDYNTHRNTTSFWDLEWGCVWHSGFSMLACDVSLASGVQPTPARWLRSDSVNPLRLNTTVGPLHQSLERPSSLIYYVSSRHCILYIAVRLPINIHWQCGPYIM